MVDGVSGGEIIRHRGDVAPVPYDLDESG